MGYTGWPFAYDEDVESPEHATTVSGNGEVSIPAQALARWNTRRVSVVDLGDRVVMRPISEDAVAAAKGKYAGRGPSADTARDAERRAARSRERS